MLIFLAAFVIRNIFIVISTIKNTKPSLKKILIDVEMCYVDMQLLRFNIEGTCPHTIITIIMRKHHGAND